jgi:hypothetical protein
MLWKFIPFGRNPMDLVKVKKGSKRLKKIVIISTRTSNHTLFQVTRLELANGRRIEVARGFDASTLERLVTVLEPVAHHRRYPRRVVQHDRQC